jgi:lipopolysaccharide/colanic/teichoic acid biosynthesis glycosyltransferase
MSAVDDTPVRYPLAKKLEDRALSAALVILLSPVLAVAAGAIALGGLRERRDRGPLLYRERRISRGNEFALLKFRVLREGVLARIGDDEHARLYEANAENLTWAGRRILKPWYLDELPQLFNVLRGDMSLVGPRPWPREMVERQLESGLDYRNQVQAGWTGPAQLQKGLVETAHYTELDQEYVAACRAWSGWRLVRYDLGILRQTLGVLARGEGLRF